MKKQAFIIRCAPNKISRVDDVLKEQQIVIGWSKTKDLLFAPETEREKFKEIIKSIYPELYENNNFSLGQATGYLWRFLKEMEIGDYALVPISKAFYIGEITSAPIFDAEKIEEDTAIRRNVNWLNNGKPIQRDYCGSGLISRLKYQGTCVGATDLIEEIEKVLDNEKKGLHSGFKRQLSEILKESAITWLNSDSAYLDDKKFEQLVSQLMIGLGAQVSLIPSKSRYKDSIADVDVIANFEHLGINIYIQVKKHKLKSDEHAVKQLIEAMKIDNPDGSKPIIGWVVTSGEFSPQAVKLADENAIKVVNGYDLAEMMVAVGLQSFKD